MKKIITILQRALMLVVAASAVTACSINDDYDLSKEITTDGLTLGSEEAEFAVPLANVEVDVVDLIGEETINEILTQLMEDEEGNSELIEIINNLLYGDSSVDTGDLFDSFASKSSGNTYDINGTVCTVSFDSYSYYNDEIFIDASAYQEIIDMLTDQGEIKIAITVKNIPANLPTVVLNVDFGSYELYDDAEISGSDITLTTEGLNGDKIIGILESDNISLSVATKSGNPESFSIDFAELNTFEIGLSIIKTGSISLSDFM